MDIKHQVKSLLQEAEIYKTQGLIIEAREKYDRVAGIIGKSPNVKNKQSLLEAISKKIQDLDNTFGKIETAPKSPQISAKAQDLIKKLFTFSADTDDDAAALEGAITLAKFGQFERALSEFNDLIRKDSLRVVAAKNILRCHIAVTSIDNAIIQYQQWLSSDLFSADHLNKICVFLEGMLEKKGIDRTLPQVKKNGERSQSESLEEDLLDISSIGITLDKGPHKGKLVELDVSFQAGNMISLIISSKDKELIENLKVGFRLNDVQFYSPIAIFQGAGIVSAKTKIDSGPKRGDYSLDIKIVST